MTRLALLALTCLTAFAATDPTPEAPARGWLGVRMAPRQVLEQGLKQEPVPEEILAIPRPEMVLESWNVPGVLVVQVLANSPAERAGVLVGDVVIDLNGIRVDSPGMLALLMSHAMAGRDAELGVLRDGARRELAFTVGERAEEQAPAVPAAPPPQR